MLKKRKETNIVYFVGRNNESTESVERLIYREKKSNEIMIVDRSMFKISS